jgi:hypothetical protein
MRAADNAGSRPNRLTHVRIRCKDTHTNQRIHQRIRQRIRLRIRTRLVHRSLARPRLPSFDALRHPLRPAPLSVRRALCRSVLCPEGVKLHSPGSRGFASAPWVTDIPPVLYPEGVIQLASPALRCLTPSGYSELERTIYPGCAKRDRWVVEYNPFGVKTGFDMPKRNDLRANCIIPWSASVDQSADPCLFLPLPGFAGRGQGEGSSLDFEFH